MSIYIPTWYYIFVVIADIIGIFYAKSTNDESLMILCSFSIPFVLVTLFLDKCIWNR